MSYQPIGEDPAALDQFALAYDTASRKAGEISSTWSFNKSLGTNVWQGESAEIAHADAALLTGILESTTTRLQDIHTALTTYTLHLRRTQVTVAQLTEDQARERRIQSNAGNVLQASIRDQMYNPGNLNVALQQDAAEEGAAMDASILRSEQLDLDYAQLIATHDEAVSACEAALRSATGFYPTADLPNGMPAPSVTLAGALGLDALGMPLTTEGAEALWNTKTPAEQEKYWADAQTQFGPDSVSGDPTQVHNGWEALDPLEKQAYIHFNAAYTGNTDGIPTTDRDQANGIALDSYLAEQRALLLDLQTTYADGNVPGGAQGALFLHQIGDGPLAIADVEARIAALEDLKLRTDTQNPSHYLMGFEPTGTGRAILATGNPDTADNVGIFVPGTSTNLNSFGGNVDRSDRLYAEASGVNPNESNSVITWLGYDPPQSIVDDAPYESFAQAGAPLFNEFADGLRVTHEGVDSANVTAIAHSYGTDVVAYSAQGTNSLAVDNVVFVASPGVGDGVDHVTDLHLDGVPSEQMTTRVYATASVADPVADTPGFIWPNDPTDPDFGATSFASTSNVNLTPLPGTSIPLVYTPSDHSAYFDLDTPSLQAMGLIIAGEGAGLR